MLCKICVILNRFIIKISCYIETSIATDNIPQINDVNEADDTTPTLPERINRGPSTDKNIAIRNIAAQIANMSDKENAGFKNEYNVRLVFNLLDRLLLHFLYNLMVYVLVMCLIFQEIPRGELYPCLEARRPEHKTKNRYTTIFPCNSLSISDNGPLSIHFKTRNT